MTVAELIGALAAYPADAPVYITACRIDEDGRACGPACLDFPLPRTIHVPDPDDEAAGEMQEAVLLDADPPTEDDVDDDAWDEPEEDPAGLEAW